MQIALEYIVWYTSNYKNSTKMESKYGFSELEIEKCNHLVEPTSTSRNKISKVVIIISNHQTKKGQKQ